MTFIIPAAVHLMQTDWDLDGLANGAFAGTSEAQPGTRNTKTNGSLPLTGTGATAFVNTQTSSATGPLRGTYWRFLATGGYDVSVNTKLLVWNWQFNAPNRIQCATVANDGVVLRLGTGSGAPPANYRTWNIAGNDTVGGQARENPKMIIIDLNASDHDNIIGTYDNTDIQSFGFGTVRFNISATSTIQYFFPRLFIFDTTKAATNIPRFTGATSTWDDTITAMGTTYNTKITDEWLKRAGDVFSIACPIEFGDNATSTQFNDNGAFVFWPNSNDATDPRVRITSQAFRVYANLRNNVVDTLTLSGFYNCGNSNPDWDLNLSNASVITLDGFRLISAGVVDIGSSVTGSASFDQCDIVNITNNGANLDGSSFKNPNGNHLLSLVV